MKIENSFLFSDDDERGQRHTLEKNGGPSTDEQLPLAYPNLLHQHSQQSPITGLSSQSSVEGVSNGSHAKLLHMSVSSGPRIEPTAPPTALMDDVFPHNEYAIYGGSIASSGGNNNPISTDSNNLINNMPAAMYFSPQRGLYALCSSALPPPTYEESEGQKTKST